MQAGKPFYDVNFWEFVLEMEKKPFNELLLQKANFLKFLQNKDLFSLPENEARQIQKRINSLTSELNILYGYGLIVEEMRNCYSDSIDKIYTAYHDRVMVLEMQVYKLQRDYLLLNILYTAGIETSLLLCDMLISKYEGNG